MGLSSLQKIVCGGLLSLIFLSPCSAQKKTYKIVSVKGSREAITDKYDKGAGKEMKNFISQYKVKFDREMKVQIATSDQNMKIGQPESLLTNFTSDQMKRYGDAYSKENTIALMNLHGHRSPMPQGVVTLENMYEIYSFDNKLVILKLKGSDLMKIFESYIRMGGAGVSSNVRLVAVGSRLISALVDGKPISPDVNYTIVTLDYLADGNDGMEGLKNAVSVEETGETLRDMMIDYVKEQTKEGKTLRSILDGRIIISN